jgi:hypothetical protein
MPQPKMQHHGLVTLCQGGTRLAIIRVKTSAFPPPSLKIIHALHPCKPRQPHQFSIKLLQSPGRSAKT